MAGGVGGIGGERPNPFAFTLEDVKVNKDPNDPRNKGAGNNPNGATGAPPAEGTQLQGAVPPVDAEGTDGTQGTDSTTSTQGPQDTPPTDSIVTTPPPQQLQDSSNVTGAPGDGNEPLPGVGGPSSRPPVDQTMAMFEDVDAAFRGAEQNIDLMYNKLIQAEKANKAELEDQIKNLEKRKDELKEQAKKLEIIQAKLAELMPMFRELMAADRDSACGGKQYTNQEQMFAQWLGEELKKVGIELTPQQLQNLTEAMTEGRDDGMGQMIAMQIIMMIAEASADMEISGKLKGADEASDPNADPNANTEEPVDAAADPNATTTAPPATGEQDVTEPTPVEVTPEAANAGFDPKTLQEKLEKIADAAGEYAAQAHDSRNDNFLDFFFPLRANTEQYNAAKEELLGAMFPGLESGLDIPLTKDFANAKDHGVDVGAISLTKEDIAVAQGLANMPFGMGPQLAFSYLESRMISQCVTKLEQINKAIDDINKEIKNLRTELAAVDERIAKLEEERNKAKAELQKAKENVKKMLEQNKDRTEDLKKILGDSISAVFSQVADSVMEIYGIDNANAPNGALNGFQVPRFPG